ncbi:metacaspase-2-like isoform X2 [Eupeodes corollae]|uniref:metacaspase-2-like isoform X2 n=1 Tax=Eupeodes corollae TaxID=290404 RepID=UPI002492E26E|nr:metacaspase-2-like isoform X2 [Eupeodes corollae]
MSMSYKRPTRETETCSILKSKKKNKHNFSDDDSIPTKELIDKIDTELKHLIGQRKILQRAKEGKKYRHTVSSKVITNSKTNGNVNCNNLYNMLQRFGTRKTSKNVDSSTQIESPFKDLDSKRICKELCKSGHVHKYTKENSNVSQNETLESYDRTRVQKVHSIKTKTISSNKNSQTCQHINKQKLRKVVTPELNFIRHSKKLAESTKSPKNDKPTKCQTFQKYEERNLEKTKSSIKRHAKLSEEILNYAKHRSNYYEHKTKWFAQKLRTKNNNLNGTSITWQSHNVSTIKPKIIDDNTYTCPDNSEENSYLILPYVGNTSREEECSETSAKPTKEFLKYRESIVKESTAKTDVPLKSPSFEIGRKAEKKQTSHESQLNQEIKRKSKLFKSSKNYDSHDLENTWESHVNRKTPLSSKFDTSQNNRTKITSPGYRLASYHPKHYRIQSVPKQTLNLERHSIHKNDISKPYVSNQNYTNKYSQTKLSPEAKQDKRIFKLNKLQNQNINGSSGNSDASSNTKKSRSSRQSFSNNIQNQASPIALEKSDLPVKLLHASSNNSETKNSLTDALSGQNKKPTNSFGSLSNASRKMSLESPRVKQTEEFGITLKPHNLLEPREVSKLEALTTKNKDNLQQTTHLKKETSPISKESSSNLYLSGGQILQQKRSSEEVKNYGLVSKSLNFEAGVISKKNLHTDEFSPENYLRHKSDPLPFKDKDLNGLNEPIRSNTSELGAISAKTKENGVMSPQVDSDRRSHNLVSVTEKFESDSKLNHYDTSLSSKTSSNGKEKSFPKNQNVSQKISPKINSSSTKTSLKYQPKNHKVDEELPPEYLTKISENSLSILAQLKTHENRSFPKNSAISAKTKEYGVMSTQVDSDRRSQNLVSVTDSKLNDYDTSMSSKTSSNGKEKNFLESQNVSRKISPKINSSSTDTSLKYQPKNHKVDDKLPPQYLTKISESSLSTLAQLKKHENPGFSKNSSKTKPKPYMKHSGMSFPMESERSLKQATSTSYTLNEKENRKSISRLFRSTLNGSELGAIPKLIPNKKKIADELTKRRTESNNESTEPGLKQTDEAISKPTTLNTSESDINEKLNLFDSSQINVCQLKEQDKSWISHSNQNSESVTSSKKILSQAELKKSPASQNLERVSNNNDEIEKSFQKQQSNFKKNLNSPVSSKSFQGPYNQKPIVIRQATSSSAIFNSVNLEENDASNRSKFSLISAQTLEKVLSNETVSEKGIHNLSEMKPTINPNMSFQARIKEERSVSSESDNELNENSDQNCSSRNKNFGFLSEMKPTINPNMSFQARIKEERSVSSESDNELNENSDQNCSSINKNVGFLSDTFNQNNVQLKGVSPDVSNLIQHLNNRVRDCDQYVKNQSQELEKLKKTCETVLALNVEDKKKLDDSKCTEDTPENDLKDESSCHCIFCEEENSTSECSDEIPPFTGCECMKEDYYKIMQIAYNS